MVASPFVVLDAPHFLRDFRRQSQIMDRGWLGFEHVGNGFWFNVTPNLTGAIGVVLVVLAVAGLAWALWRRTRLDLMLAPYVIVYFVYIGTWKELADRYLLVIVPLLLLLAARVCVELVDLARPRTRARGRRRWRSRCWPSPSLCRWRTPSPSTARSAAPTRARWRGSGSSGTCPAGSLIAVENYGPPLVREDVLDHYRAAGLDPVAYRLLRLKLPAPETPDRSRDLQRLRRQGVEYVITSSRVRDRVLAAPEEYPTIVAFYAQLDAQAELVREFRPGHGETGPVLRLYRL